MFSVDCRAKNTVSVARRGQSTTMSDAAEALTADEAQRQAEAEGLTLVRSDLSCSGFKSVSFYSNAKRRPYQARAYHPSSGKSSSLGYFATAEEAALSVARAAAPPAASPAPPPPMTAEEAVQQAEAGGLKLLRSETNATGFENVFFNPYNESEPYFAQVRRGGSRSAPVVNLGSFSTAEAAALGIARTREGRTLVLATAAAAVLACSGGSDVSAPYSFEESDEAGEEAHVGRPADRGASAPPLPTRVVMAAPMPTTSQAWLDHEVTVVEGISFAARHSRRAPSPHNARPVHKPRWSAAVNHTAAASRLGLALDLRGVTKPTRPLLHLVVGSSKPVGSRTSMRIVRMPGAKTSFVAANHRLRQVSTTASTTAPTTQLRLGHVGRVSVPARTVVLADSISR